MTKIIATSLNAGGANAILPVIQRFDEEGHIEVITIGHSTSEGVFRKEEEKGVFVPLVRNYRTIRDYDLGDISVYSMGRILDIEKPDLVLTGTGIQDKNNPQLIDQTTTLAARDRGIDTLAVLDFHSHYSGRISNLEDGQIIEGSRHRYMPTLFAIMDEFAEKDMLEEGFPKEKLRITGNPAFDKLIGLKESFTEEDRKKIRETYGFGLNDYIVFFLSQPIKLRFSDTYGYVEEDSIRAVLGPLQYFQRQTSRQISVLIRAHPAEKKADLETIAKDYPRLHIEVDHKDDQRYGSEPCMLATDATFSPWSTELIKSSYLGVPSISIQPGLKIKDPLITNRLGVTPAIYENEKAREVLEKLVFGEEAFARELAERRKDFKIDGKATARVAKLVYGTLILKALS